MLRNLFFAAGILCSCLIASAQSTRVVQQFGTTLSNWASGYNSFSSLTEMERLCSKKPVFIIADKIMYSLASKNGLAKTDSYKWDDYITSMQKEVDKGISVRVSDIKYVSEDEVVNNYKGYQYASCDISISGAFNESETALFIIKDDKIAKIQDFETTVDSKTGKRRVLVDWSDLNVEETTIGFGLTYNYSKTFPIGATMEFSCGKFMIGVDFGINQDKDLYTTQKVDFSNIVDYKITKGEYDLKYFITVSPAFYLKYFSAGCGFGFAGFKGTEYTNGHHLTVNTDGSTIQDGAYGIVISDKMKFMMRPTVKGYIPCSENFFIALSVNYDWILGCKEKSGISFGAGFHLLLDDY